jgi:hypothetical protein
MKKAPGNNGGYRALLDRENNGVTIFRNVGRHSPFDTASHLTRLRVFNNTTVKTSDVKNVTLVTVKIVF